MKYSGQQNFREFFNLSYHGKTRKERRNRHLVVDLGGREVNWWADERNGLER